MIKEAIEKVRGRADLEESEMRACFEEIMSGKARDAEIAAFLTALRDKGETVEEITAAVKVMRAKSARIDVGDGALVDTCGTGGTGVNTFNISTVAAFVAAGCGVKIAKHGNRSASGHAGSADVLEALGVKIELPPESVSRCIKEAGIGFLFAPVFHSAMKYSAPARKTLGGSTIFNILGPLSNPAGAKYQIIGVYDAALTETIAEVLKNLGTKKAFIAHGADSLDEITITGPTRITELNAGKISTRDVTPEEFGVKRAGLEAIKGASAKENAAIFLAVLKGEKSPRRDIALMNAGAAIVCANRAKDFKEGMKLAAESVDSGRALEKLEKLIAVTNSNP